MIDLLKQHAFFKDKTIDRCTCLEHQGYCNENYLVMAGDKKYIVRKLLRDDIDRNLEWRLHKLAFAKDITAEPFVFDVENSFMVFEFLVGEHKEVETLVPPDDLKLLAITLRKLHNIVIDIKPIELPIENKTDEVIKAFETIDKYPKEYVLCHNDLNSQNIFFSDTVKFIDWEYAGANDLYFDLATISMEFKLSVADEAYFLASYFLKEGWEKEKLEAHKTIYTALCKQWFENNPTYSTVTDLAKFLGISTSFPSLTEISSASNCVTTIISKNSNIG